MILCTIPDPSTWLKADDTRLTKASLRGANQPCYAQVQVTRETFVKEREYVSSQFEAFDHMDTQMSLTEAFVTILGRLSAHSDSLRIWRRMLAQGQCILIRT